MTDKKQNIGKNVFIAGLVSFFMDFSSEMIYPLVPIFLSDTLGLNKSFIGLIEGIAESTSSLLRVFSGWYSDKIGNRKWLMVLGYSISTLSRPMIATASSWQSVLTARFTDRFGKGVRVAPRDALISESTDRAYLGRAFGLQRAMDTLGAVAGPSTAFFLLWLFSNDYRTVFWVSIIPATIAVLLIIFFIVETRGTARVPSARPEFSLRHFDLRFKFFVVIAAVFALGNSSDAFLILKARDTGIAAEHIPLLYLSFNIVYALSAVPAGIAADRFGMKRIILLSFILFSVIYTGFALAGRSETIWILFCVYGIFMGLTEGVQKAYLATIIPESLRGTAYGLYNTAIGLATLPASLLAGWLWDNISPAATFLFGAATATLSALMFLVFIIYFRRNGNVRS